MTVTVRGAGEEAPAYKIKTVPNLSTVCTRCPTQSGPDDLNLGGQCPLLLRQKTRLRGTDMNLFRTYAKYVGISTHRTRHALRPCSTLTTQRGTPPG